MSTEQYRYQCEVRFILSLRAKDGRSHATYLEGVAKRRGEDAVKALRADCLDQWKKGNRGGWGVWL